VSAVHDHADTMAHVLIDVFLEQQSKPNERDDVAEG
jgi:hypothetical protein